ncbi:MAG: T9SS type A sorting domain-containing protein [Chitinophagaceae bacterium]|nr:T9SS type A sorting domain-containing protein [Chitinophagaceae bacterium]
MRTRKIQLSLVTGFLLSQAGALFTPLSSVAQSCTGTIQSTGYNTTFAGTGNATYSVTWPQYAPPSGYTLVSAVLKSVVSLTASFELTNPGGTDLTNVRPGVTGEDVLQVNGNNLTDADGNDISTKDFVKNLPAVPLIHAGQTYSYPATQVYNNFKMMTDSLATDNGMLNGFIGTGNMAITYSNTPGYTINAVVNVTPSYSITNKISMTYYYCYTGPLAADILTFTATRQSDGTVALNWISGNEQGGRHYVVQVSGGNGSDFLDINMQPASRNSGSAAYSYIYTVTPADKDRLYFRIKVVDALGTVAYSPLRIIYLGAGGTPGGFSIYPNPPSDHINVIFPFLGRQGWQVDILAADGRLVLRSRYSNVAAARVDFQQRLAAGAYFVRATDIQSAESHSTSFVIR